MDWCDLWARVTCTAENMVLAKHNQTHANPHRRQTASPWTLWTKTQPEGKFKPTQEINRVPVNVSPQFSSSVSKVVLLLNICLKSSQGQFKWLSVKSNHSVYFKMINYSGLSVYSYKRAHIFTFHWLFVPSGVLSMRQTSEQAVV